MSISIKVSTKSNVADAIKANHKANKLSILELCIKIRGEAFELAPFDTSFLRNSLTYKTNTVDFGGDSLANIQPKANEGYVGTNVEYAIYQEFGTKHTKPRPYLRPAILIASSPQQREEIIDLFSGVFDDMMPDAK